MWPPTPIKTSCLIKTGGPAQKELGAQKFAPISRALFSFFTETGAPKISALSKLYLLRHFYSQNVGNCMAKKLKFHLFAQFLIIFKTYEILNFFPFSRLKRCKYFFKHACMFDQFLFTWFFTIPVSASRLNSVSPLFWNSRAWMMNAQFLFVLQPYLKKPSVLPSLYWSGRLVIEVSGVTHSQTEFSSVLIPRNTSKCQ